MSLPSVEWRYVGRNYVGTGTIGPNIILDTIYSLATSSSYYDGSARVASSGSAGVWNRYQNAGITEAIYVVPPSGSQSIIIAGSSNTPSPSPTMNTSIGGANSYAINKLFVNITKNPGNFSSWNASNPFTSGNAFGYVPFLGSRSSSTVGITNFGGSLYTYLFESKESIAIFIVESNSSNSTSYSNGFIAGAILDPESTHSLDAENDGRIYGIFSTGHASSTSLDYANWATNITPIWNSNWHDTTGSTGFAFLYGYNASLAAGARAGIFIPGSANTQPIIASNMFLNVIGNSVSNNFISNSDSYIRFPILIKAALSNNPVCFGVLRGIKYCSPGILGQIHSYLDNTVGYVVSCSNNPSYPSQAILLEHS